MKYFRHLAFILMAMNLQAQVLDGSFEKWDTVYYPPVPPYTQFVLVPQVWQSNNEIYPDWHPFLLSTPATQSGDSPFGDFSLKLESAATFGIDESGPGILYQQIPAASLSAISYWMKCDTLAGASGCIVEIFGMGQEPELLFQDSIHETHPVFQEYIIKSEDLNSIDYKSIVLQFRAVGYGGLTDHPPGFTRMYIDEVKADYLSHTSELAQETKVFPNPVSTELNLKSSNQKISRVDIYHINGDRIKSAPCSLKHCVLDIHELPNGIYTIVIKFTDGNTLNKRVIKANQ